MRDKVLDNLKQFLPGKWRNLARVRSCKRRLTALSSDSGAEPRVIVDRSSRAKGRCVAWRNGPRYQRNESVRKTAVQTLGQLPNLESVQALRGLMEDRILRERCRLRSVAWHGIGARGMLPGRPSSRFKRPSAPRGPHRHAAVGAGRHALRFAVVARIACEQDPSGRS